MISKVAMLLAVIVILMLASISDECNPSRRGYYNINYCDRMFVEFMMDEKSKTSVDPLTKTQTFALVLTCGPSKLSCMI